MNFQNAPAWKAIGLLSILIGFFLLLNFGRYLVLLFPICSLFVGIYLYKRFPGFYVGFTLWMFFLGPLIKRLIDYQSGYITPGAWNLVPFLVASISFDTLIRKIFTAENKDRLPFILCFGSVCYAFLIGLVQNPITTRFLPYFFQWFSPIAFGFYIVTNWHNYPEYRMAVQKSLYWGVLVMGLYGVFQFLVAPPWDCFFLENIDATSFGKPEPFGIRVWSTMEAPHTFGTAMMSGLILLFSNVQGTFYLPSLGIGYLSFLLTQARTTWLSWGVALLSYLIFFGGWRRSYSIMITIIVFMCLIIVLNENNFFSDVINNRLDTLNDLSQDTSTVGRINAFDTIIQDALREFLGKGIGFKISIFETELGPNDSTIIPMLLTFGWLGLIPYLIGILLIFVEIFSTKSESDIFIDSTISISIGIFSQIGLNYIFTESLGMIFWIFLSLNLIGKKYSVHYHYQ